MCGSTVVRSYGDTCTGYLTTCGTKSYGFSVVLVVHIFVRECELVKRGERTALWAERRESCGAWASYHIYFFLYFQF